MKKIYTEETAEGTRVVIDYGSYKTYVDVEDSEKTGLGDDRVYIAHECTDGDMVDIACVAVNNQGYIVDTYWNGDVEYSETIWFEDIDETFGEDEESEEEE